MNKIAILVTTMGREDMLEKAITSMIKYRPENTVILIGDQGLKNIDIVKKANNKLEGEEIGKLNPIKLMLEKEGVDLSFEDIRLAKLFI